MEHNHTIIWMDGIGRQADQHVDLFGDIKMPTNVPEGKVIILNPKERYISFLQQRKTAW